MINEKLIKISSLILLSAEKGLLKKAILSKPKAEKTKIIL